MPSLQDLNIRPDAANVANVRGRSKSGTLSWKSYATNRGDNEQLIGDDSGPGFNRDCGFFSLCGSINVDAFLVSCRLRLGNLDFGQNGILRR